MSYADTHRLGYELFNARDLEAQREHVAAGFRYTDCASGTTFEGFDTWLPFLRSWIDGFSDARVELDDAEFIEGDHASVCLFHATGTHDGTFAGMPATGRRLDTQYCEVLRFDDAGKIVSGRLYYDRMTIMEQLGVAAPAAQVPQPSQPAPSETGTPVSG
ncbi:MAG: ester cyclase [Actinomycetota bacterium]